MKTTLVLKNDGSNFEHMYYQAICLGELEKAERLYAQYRKTPSKFFWRDAFRAQEMQETTLMSAIINLFSMPFGSYVFKRLDDDIIEIEPWLYADAGSKQALIDALRSETADAQTLHAYARTLHLTADFLSWLEAYEKTAEGNHG